MGAGGSRLLIIGIDSSGFEGEFAILRDGKLKNRFLEYAEDIPSYLKKEGILPDEISAIGVSIGPGSFTGLRVGLAIAMGMAKGLVKDFFGVPTFNALLDDLEDGIYIPLLHARRGVVFSGRIEKKGRVLKRLINDGVYTLDTVLDWDGIFIGNAVRRYRERLKGKRVINDYSIASNVARIVERKLSGSKENVFINPSSPVYLSPSEAERKRKGEYQVTPILIGDIAQLLEIEKEAFQEPWDASSFLMLLSEGNRCLLWKIEKNGIIAGYIIGCFHGEGFHLMNIAVRKGYRRQGIARSLLHQLLKHLRNKGMRDVHLEVRIHNYPAIELYKMFGFRIEKIVPHYYRNGDDAIIMRLPL